MFWVYRYKAPAFIYFRCYLVLAKPKSPVVTTFQQLIESHVPIPVAMCTTSGFRPQRLNITWKLEDEPTESTTNVNVTKLKDENTFSAVAVYPRSISRADNGKKLVCSVYHETGTPMSAETIILVQCKCSIKKVRHTW